MVNMESNCCQAEMKVHSEDDGTCYYYCVSCKEPCDPEGGYDFEKLDQKLDLMLGAYNGNKNIKPIKLKLAGWLQKVVDWLK